MITKILKNPGLVDITIEDMGITIPSGGEIVLERIYYLNWANSADTVALVTSGDLIVNDGINDLNVGEGLRYLEVSTKVNIKTEGTFTSRYIREINFKGSTSAIDQGDGIIDVDTTVTADEVSFDNINNDFNAEDVQEAIEEAKQNAEGFPRSGISRNYNGTMSNNEWMGPSELLPNTPFCVLPVKTKINEMSWANSKNSVDFDVEFRTGSKTGTIFYTLEVRDEDVAGYVDGLSFIFPVGTIIYAQYKDKGTNCKDFEFTVWISRVAE